MNGCGAGADGREVVQPLPGGGRLEFGPGRIDRWCVYRVAPSGFTVAPRDREVFDSLAALAGRFGAEQVYGHFVRIYDHTSKCPDQNILDGIRTLARQAYRAEERLAAEVFSLLYMSMVSEENKARTQLGRRIKRLGVHQLLLEDKTPEEAARAFDGRTAEELGALCRARGF